MEEKIKSVLYGVYKIDQINNRFNNKFNYMNLVYPLQRADTWNEEKLDRVIEALEAIFQEVQIVHGMIDRIEQPVLNLIDSYAD